MEPLYEKIRAIASLRQKPPIFLPSALLAIGAATKIWVRRGGLEIWRLLHQIYFTQFEVLHQGQFLRKRNLYPILECYEKYLLIL